MKKLLFLVTILALFASMIGACGPSATPTPVPPKPAEPTKAAAPATPAGPKSGGALVFATSVDVPSLEPHLEAADAWHRRKALIYQNLTWVDNDVVVQPQLGSTMARMSWEKRRSMVCSWVWRVFVCR